MTQQLGFKLVDSRTNEDGTVQSDIDLAPLALGALTDGVTVREMQAVSRPSSMTVFTAVPAPTPR